MSTRDEIEDALAGYAAALHARDADAAARCFTADAVVMAPQAPTASGADGVRALYGQIVAALDLDIAFEIEDLLAAGEDEAAVFTHSTGTQTAVADGSASSEANREAFVFVRRPEGWRIRRYLFNTVS